jgi:hypothetical protein
VGDRKNEKDDWVSGARRALALALTEMVRDSEITHEEALGIARKVLRENAVKVYNLEKS